MSAHVILGNDNAENDQLLLNCKVARFNSSDNQPILMGRWGTGKTAILLMHNEIQTQKLREAIGKTNAKIWFINESAITLEQLTHLKSKYSEDKLLLQKSLEEIWKTEIIRVYCILLNAFKPFYANTKGNHWEAITKVANSKRIANRIWDNIPLVISASVDSHLVNVQESYDNQIINKDLYNNLNLCLCDLKEDEIKPCVALEPIESPASAIENEKDLAQLIIFSLLNTFKSYFEPSEKNNFNSNVRISIPWHRFHDSGELEFPQKLNQYCGIIRWTKEQLREFINKRIEAEFNRLDRKVNFKVDKDYWGSFVPEKLVNKVCDPPINEDSFDYFIRHTHYRPRDLQTLLRKCIESQAIREKVSEDTILKSFTLSENVIKDTFRRECINLADFLINEGQRKNTNSKEVINALKGMNVPFDTDYLSDRFRKRGITMDFNDSLQLLWSLGVIGCSAKPIKPEASELLLRNFTDENKISFLKDKHTIIDKWVWFEYNYAGQIIELKDKLENLNTNNNIRIDLIIHPKLFERLSIHIVDNEAPTGI